MQLIQMLLSPPEGILLTLLSSLVFIMLAVLALELIGWFIFLGLLVTILAYLLLIILFARWEIHGHHHPTWHELRLLRIGTVGTDIPLLGIVVSDFWTVIAKDYMDTLHIPFNFSSYYYPVHCEFRIT
ncbi:hypothetical protein C8R45DRAFT_1019015 [Mycena sanguinolenta]|nr:hypothetical protein C8R45DRAFT_1019015 [Mycena sanguinolenta]